MSTPLRDLLHDLLFDPPARAAFAAAPEQYLGDHGWDGLRGEDVEAALDALTDELPPEHAARIAPLVTGDGIFDDGFGGAIAGLEAATAAIDGELPTPPADPVDPGTTLDHVEPDDLDDVDDLGDVDGPDDLAGIEALAFGAAEEPDSTLELPVADESPATESGGDPASGIDFGDAPADADDAGPWTLTEDEPAIDADEPDDDVID